MSSTNLWDEILNSVSGRTSSSVSKKNLIVLGEPRTGKSTLLSHVLRGASSSLIKPIALPPTVKKATSASGSTSSRLDLASGYEWVDVRDEGDEETLPPLSIYAPPSSHPSLLQLLPLSLSQPPPPPTTASSSSSPPPTASSVLADTSILIVLDWTKPAVMISQLLSWLEWVENWSRKVAGRDVEGEENRERLQYHLQHYNEPSPPPPMSSPQLGGTSPTKQTLALPSAPAASTSYTSTTTEVLPLGPGTLTRNPYGVPITIVCTKADQIDVVAEELGFGGPAGSGGGKGVGGKGGWEERTDWIGQVLRLVALMHGASLFYTSQAHPETFSLLRAYLLHRIFSPSPSTSSSTANSNSTLAAPSSAPVATSTRFPFPHRANVLDRDQVLVPAGWDSWGKIMVLREGFEPERVTAAWDVSLRSRRGEEVDDAEEDVEDLWEGVVPILGEDVVHDPSSRMITTTLDQTFLAKEYASILNDPKRDPRQSFRNPASASTATASPGDSERVVGVVGPMGSGGLSLPGVEKAMADMEGLSGKGGRPPMLSTNSSSRDYSSPLTSPSLTAGGGGSSLLAGAAGTPGSGQPAPSTEALHNFFQSLLTARKNTTGGLAGVAGSTAASTPKAP